MDIIKGTTDFFLKRETAVAIGKFDGVHIGHRKLLGKILEQKERGLDACVFTFSPAPAVLLGLSDGRELTTPEEKREIFARMGVDVLVEFPMTPETLAITPEDFVREILVKRMKVRLLAAGEDLSFGKGGKGNAGFLAGMSGECGFSVDIIDKVFMGELEVSSTAVRRILETGDMEQVNLLLGEPFSLSGSVVHGNHIGRTLGFPTVNLPIPGNKLLPPRGVYESRVYLKGNEYRGITNIGCKPTVEGEYAVGAETYIFDFDRDVYGEEIRISLLSFRRPEKKFSNLEELQRQLQRDIETMRDTNRREE